MAQSCSRCRNQDMTHLLWHAECAKLEYGYNMRYSKMKRFLISKQAELLVLGGAISLHAQLAQTIPLTPHDIRAPGA